MQEVNLCLGTVSITYCQHLPSKFLRRKRKITAFVSLEGEKLPWKFVKPDVFPTCLEL